MSQGNASTICCAVHAAVGCSVLAKWAIRRRRCASTTKTYRMWFRTVGTTKKSMETRLGTWFARNARHVGDAGWGRFTRYRSTVDFATSMPSMCNSDLIRGASQSTLAADICRMRSWISCGIGGRPGPGRPESWAQYWRNLRRRQAITVAGFTMTSTSFQRDQSRESPHQKRRSRRRRRGRRTER